MGRTAAAATAPATPPPAATGPDTRSRPAGAGALLVGEIVVTLVVIGFLVGRSVGIPLWAVAAAADVVLVVTLGELPWRAIPWQTALIVAGLGVLAAAAVADLSIGGSSAATERSPWPARPGSAGWRPMSSTICPLC